MENRGKAVPRGAATSPESAMASELFDHFVSASTFKSVLHTNRQLCELLRLKPTNISNFYPRLKAKLHSWRAASLWAKLDKRASHKCYNRGKACPNKRVLIIGAGPCGLRTAIEAQLLGAKVVVVEKRDRFSRNNVLHLWPFVIHDLRSLGSKKFFGKFCAGSIDHISIRQLQIILLKVALLLGVEVHVNVGFEGLIEPPEDQSQERIGWHAHVSPTDHPVSQYEFDVLIGADGKRNTLLGFNRKEFRGKLAIAVTANFINKHSPEEARVPEISGVAFIFNQKFFQDMKEQTAIDLENIVYYKDDTHYFVMTAKKQSLLERGVIIQDFADTARLLASENVDREALMEYARDAADFATSGQLPHLDFAVNHYGQADVAMFDFTSMYAAENACRVVQKRDHKLLQGLVGDSLLEPFWPTGSGCARGFLSAFDAAWMIRSWASGKLSTLQVLAERESIYRLLAQTTPENLSKDLNQYTLNPSSRYPNLNLQAVLPSQVRSLFTTDGKIEEMALDAVVEAPKKKRRRESMIHPDTLLNWCKKQVALSDKVTIQDFTSSWKDGLALCTILHHYRPDLIDLSALDPENIAKNNQLAFDICERELGIPPVMTGQEMAECTVPDKLTMVSYISQVYESFRGEIPVVSHPKLSLEERTVSPSKLGSSSPLFILNKVSSRVQGKRKYSIEKELAKERERGENVKKRSSIFTHKRRSRDKAGFTGDKNQDIVLTNYKSIPINKPRESINTRVKNLEAQMKKDAGLRCHQSGEGDLARPSQARGEPTELNIKMLQQQLQSAEKVPNVKKARSPKVGKLRKDEWNVKIIEEKIKQVKSPQLKNPSPEKPKIFKEIFSNKLHAMNEVLKAGGSLTPEEAAKYREFDASLNKLKTRLTKGNLETGEKGHNQTAAMSEHMTTIWNKKDGRRRDPLPPAPVKPHEETDSQKSSDSTVCYFCKGRVYLMQRLSAEGLFFHRTCFKCEYCGNVLRLGDFAFDKDAGGKFYCTAHFRMQKTDLRQQEMMKRKQAFLTCALEQEKEKLYQIIRDNTEKALSPGRQAGTTSPTVTDSNVPAVEKTEPPISPSNYLAEPVGTIGRDQTPERVEYENSILELSEDELLTSELEEEELTQKNLGPSQDLATSEDDYSDLSTDSESDEEAFAEELERSLTADETRKLAETWNRKYSAEQSLLYSLSSSSADDEGSDTEIGSDDTSHDIDSDAEYSIENSEEDGAQTKDSENPSASKSPEEKEFSMEVPVIDLKSMNRVSEDETTSETDELIDEDGDMDEETGTEVDSESESESTPPPPQQIPTIVIYESPPQNTELDQEWNENSAAVKDQETVDENVNATINLSSDTSISNSKEENQDHDLLDPELNAEEDIDLDFNEDDDGKCIEVTDKDKNDDSLCSRVEAKVSDEDNLEIKASELMSPTQVKAPLAVGESSSDLSVSSEIDSLAKDIVSDVIKAAESTIIEQLSPKDKIDCQIPADDSLAPQELSGIGSKVVEEEHGNIFCSTPYSKEPVVKISIPETSSIQNIDKSKAKLYVKNTEEIDLCSPSPQNTMIVTDKVSSPSNSKELAQNLFPSEKLNEFDKISFDANESVVILNESFPVPQPETPLHSISREELPKEVENLKKVITEACVDDTVVLDDSSDLPILSDESIDASRNTTSFITVRKKQNTTKNDSLEWDSDKSMSILPVFYEEEISIDDFNKKINCVAEADKLSAPKLMAESLQNHDIKESDLVANVNLSPELSSQIDLANSCLSQSLPNSSTPFLLGPSFPKTVSCTSAEFENAKLEKLSSLKNYTPLSTSELRLKGSEESLLDEKPSKFVGKNYFSGNSKNSMSDSLDNSKQSTPSSSASKSETKYKGYSGSFAEKVRPKSLFCDDIYLRSLDIKLTKQPFSSLNKSNDNLDEHVGSDKDSVKKRLFDEAHKSPNLVSNKPVISNASTLSLGSSFTASTDTITTSVLKTTTPTDKLTNASLNKHKNPCHKQSSVSFSTESYGDLVSPYNCNQSKPSEISFPTKVKPKCDLDITKLRQKREKRKSVHEDLQGLPFADEDKLVSPVDPLSSSEVFVPPKASNSQDKGLSTPTMEQSLPQYKTPDLIDEERYLRMQSTVEQKKAREEARARARLKSDEELGLSPNNYRKKYRRQLSLNSINYDELCSDEFCDQEDEELEDDIINNFCQTKNLGIEDTFNMFKNTDLYTDSKTADKCIISSQQCTPQPIETKALPSSSDELIASTDSLDTVESAKCQEPQPSVRKTKKHSSNTSSSETSPEVCKLDSPFDSKLQAGSNSKTCLTDGSAEEEKLKSNGKKSIFSILNFGKSNVSKEKTKQKSKGSEKDLSSSLPSDIGARSNPKGKPFSNLKLSISKEKGMKPKAKSVPPESVPASPLESIYATNNTPYVSLGAQQSKVIPKYTVYRNPETALSSFPEPTISTFPVHLPVPKMENGLAPKASEDSFSDEDDTQGNKAGHLPSAEKADKNEKERKAQRILQKVQRQQVLKRMRNAQEMQRRLEELEIQQKEIEVQGVQLEKILRGEHHAINGGKGETELEQEWYTLVHTKNKLTREVQELYIRLKDIELEERQSRLQQDFAQRMADGFRKNQTQLIEERKILDEMLQIVDKRNELVKVLDQLKLREEENEIVIGSDVFTKGMKSPLSPSEKS